MVVLGSKQDASKRERAGQDSRDGRVQQRWMRMAVGKIGDAAGRGTTEWQAIG